MGYLTGFIALDVVLCIIAGTSAWFVPRMIDGMDMREIAGSFRIVRVAGLWHGSVKALGLTHLSAIHHTHAGAHRMLRHAVLGTLSVPDYVPLQLVPVPAA